jgi:hypothetical protein
MKMKIQAPLLALACLANSALAAASFTITPSAVSNTYSGQITLQVAGLTSGSTVVVRNSLISTPTTSLMPATGWRSSLA